MTSIKRDEKFHDFLSKEKIIIKFNFSRTLWWRRQYEGLIELTGQGLYKSIGNLLFTWSELKEVLLDVEVNLKNRSLTYTEEYLDYSVLTINFMTLGRDIKLPHDSREEEEVSDNRKKRQRYVYKCKEAVWKRWVHENLAALRERQNLSLKEKPEKININGLAMIKGDETTRSMRIRTEKRIIELPI